VYHVRPASTRRVVNTLDRGRDIATPPEGCPAVFVRVMHSGSPPRMVAYTCYGWLEYPISISTADTIKLSSIVVRVNSVGDSLRESRVGGVNRARSSPQLLSH